MSVSTSIWSAIHPRLLELIRAHRSTLIFVNSRRLAERLAGALNELAGETLVRSHHGSIARDAARRGRGPAQGGRARARSSPPRRSSSASTWARSISSSRSRRRRRSPAACSASAAAAIRSTRSAKGVIFPKFRGDLVACAAVAAAMHEGAVEATRYPRNPLDVVAQQIVAMAAMDDVDGRRAVRRRSARAAPFAELSRARVRRRARHAVGTLSVRRVRRAAAAHHLGSRRRHADRRAKARSASRSPTAARFPIAGSTASSSPAPDRARRASASSTRRWSSRARVGETFVLGASTWRIEEITHDRVLVSPAPGEPGKMPFWKGDQRRPAARARARDRQADARAAAACRRRRRSIG